MSTYWLTACLIALAFLAMLGTTEILSQALSPVSDALTPIQTPIIGESWCIRADGGPCP